MYKLTPEGMWLVRVPLHLTKLTHFLVPPYVMYLHNNVIKKVNIHGGELANIYSGGQPRGLAFDYR